MLSLILCVGLCLFIPLLFSGHKGHEQNKIELPKVDDPYMINAFTISKEHGFGMIEAPIEVSVASFICVMAVFLQKKICLSFVFFFFLVLTSL